MELELEDCEEEDDTAELADEDDDWLLELEAEDEADEELGELDELAEDDDEDDVEEVEDVGTMQELPEPATM